MTERTGDYEWRMEGEEAGAVLYAPDEAVLEYPRLRSGVEAATRLPGVEDPVYAAASPHGGGWVASSRSHVAPGLVSTPRIGLLLAAATPLDRLGVSPRELPRLLARRLSEASMPALGDADLHAACETGFRWAAGEGFIEEEDLELLGAGDVRGEPDALGSRALAAGTREWDPRPESEVTPLGVGEVLDSEAADALGLYEGALVFRSSVGSGELGRLALEGHRQRMISRDFGDAERLVAAPAGTEESADLVAAVGAAAGYAVARAALLLYALRRAIGEEAGRLEPIACWTAGGMEERGDATIHRRSLARLGAGEAISCGDTLARGTGAMLGSAPPFDAGGEGEWPWEDAGLLEPVTRLEEPGGHRDG